MPPGAPHNPPGISNVIRVEGSGPWSSGAVTWKTRLTQDPLLTDIDIPLTAALSDRYRIERELGRGGMATIYLAQDLKHDRPLALKVLHPELARDLAAQPQTGPDGRCFPLRGRSLAIHRRIYGEQCSRATPLSLQVMRNRTASTSTSATCWRSKAGFGSVSPISI